MKERAPTVMAKAVKVSDVSNPEVT